MFAASMDKVLRPQQAFLILQREIVFCTKQVSFECLVSEKKIPFWFFLVDEVCLWGFIEVLPLVFLFFFSAPQKLIFPE